MIYTTKVTGFTAIERNNKVADYVRRGYRILDRGKHHVHNNPSNRLVYWATVVKEYEQSG